LCQEGNQLQSLAYLYFHKKKANHTHWTGCWLDTKAILNVTKKKSSTLASEMTSIPCCFVEQMQGFVIKKTVKQHSKHTSNHDTYHCLGPRIPKKLTSNYGVTGEGKI
jgi:hypothetical protein